MYFINSLKDPFTEHYSWRCSWPLDVEAMNRAASLLLGTHDFSCFEKTGGANKTSICTVTEAFWAPCSPTAVSLLGLPPAALAPGALAPENYLAFRVTADRFLRNMVRAMVGTLIDVGRGKRSPESMAALLESRDRCSAGESVPARALFLVDVRY